MHKDCIGVFLKCIHLNLCSEQRPHGNQARTHIDSPQENSCKKRFGVVRSASTKIKSEENRSWRDYTSKHCCLNNSKCSVEVDFLHNVSLYRAFMKDCSLLKIFMAMWAHKQKTIFDILKFIRGPRLGGIKQKKCVIHHWASRWLLLFYSPRPRSHVWILIYRDWSIRGEKYNVFSVQGGSQWIGINDKWQEEIVQTATDAVWPGG